mgnify:CR=1 FL=1
MNRLKILVVGGGPAGFFAAIAAAQRYPEHEVTLIEKNRQLLSKVRISGGGRCNVTHACFDPTILVSAYPRGSKELKGPFSLFHTKDTIKWFEEKGVKLKTEEDGRMFPITDCSETIIQCLQAQAAFYQVKVKTEAAVSQVTFCDKKFAVELSNQQQLKVDRLLFATGSHPKSYQLIESLGHSVVPLVPSLFTFNIPSSPLRHLAGVSCLNVKAQLPALSLEQVGSLLITHWGLSGPAILKLSALAARKMHAVNYQTSLRLDWLPQETSEQVREKIIKAKEKLKHKQVATESLFTSLCRQLWKQLVEEAKIPTSLRWGHLSNYQLKQLLDQLKKMELQIEGKTTYKQEFVTAGGIHLKEINFKKMESKLVPGLFFAGEVLNIDGITGGFNFQNCWTTGWIAGQAIGET